MFEHLRHRFTSFFSAPKPERPASRRPSPLPHAVRTLSVDEQVHWAYRNFRPEVARCIARGIRARAAEEHPCDPMSFA